MKSSEHLYSNGVFEYDALKCLRNEYAHNACHECITICPESAFSLARQKLQLLTDTCTSCGVCMGSCPSAALGFHEHFDVEMLIKRILNEPDPLLTCKRNVPCLASLHVEVLSTMALGSKVPIVCDLSLCDTCELNQQNGLLEVIEQRLDEAQRLADIFGLSGFQKTYEQQVQTRRGFLRQLKKLGVTKMDDGVVDMAEYQTLVPNHRKAFQKVLKKQLNEQEAVFEEPLSMFHGKRIDDFCTNCGECVQFCPTGALSYGQDCSALLFQSGKCIGCHICSAICKDDAVKDTEHFSLIDFAYNKAYVLMQHRLAVCTVCRCAFSQKKEETVCPRCARFEEDHGALFRLASEL